MWEKFKQQGMLIQLILINVGVFVAFNILQFIFTWDFTLIGHTDPGKFIWRPWSALTSMFLHAGIWHLASNMMFLYISGQIFLMFFGQRKFLSVYLLSGFAGFFLLMLMAVISPKIGYGTVVGASAAVMGMVVSTAVYAPNHIIRLAFIGEVKWWIIAAILVVIDFAGINGSMNAGGHIAHIGGGLFGFLFIYFYRRGTDLSKGFENILDRVFNLFKREKTPVFKVYKNKSSKFSAERQFKTDEEFNLEKKANEEKLNGILDKISKSGYDSLSKSEKDFLFNQSKK